MVKSSSGRVHPAPDSIGAGWVNQVHADVVSRHRTQTTTAERGRELAGDGRTAHGEHRPGGRICRANSYGNDPNPPRDRR